MGRKFGEQKFGGGNFVSIVSSMKRESWRTKIFWRGMIWGAKIFGSKILFGRKILCEKLGKLKFFRIEQARFSY